MGEKSRNVKKMFDEISLNVVKYLEEQSGVTGIQFVEKSPATTKDLAVWEKENYPFVLPTDLKNFYMMTDGLLLRWYMKLKDELLPLGCMNINGIASLKKYHIDRFKFFDTSDNDSESSEDDDNEPENTGHSRHPALQRPKKKAADPVLFNIDNTCQDGVVALLFRSRTTKPEVWFQDLACQWHFLAGSFTDYFRLLVMHVGLPHWQYSFTDVGLPPTSKEWFRFVAPERLAIDIKNARVKDPDIEYIVPGTKSMNGVKVNLAKIDKAVVNATKKTKRPTKLVDVPPIDSTGRSSRSGRPSRTVASALRSRTSMEKNRPRSSIASRMRRSDSQGGGEDGGVERPASAASFGKNDRLRTYSSSGSAASSGSRVGSTKLR